MACSCHSKQKKNILNVNPLDYCSNCASKHMNLAYQCWNQFQYEIVNRDYVSGQLRNAMNHLKDQHRQLAIKIRDLAIVIQECKDLQQVTPIKQQMKILVQEVRQIFFIDYPQVKRKLEEIKLKFQENNING